MFHWNEPQLCQETSTETAVCHELISNLSSHQPTMTDKKLTIVCLFLAG